MNNNPFKYSVKTDSGERISPSLAVIYAGHQKCEPCHCWGSGIRSHYVLHYVVSGRGSYYAGGKSYQLSKGDCFLIYPSAEISYRAYSLDPWEYYWVNFSGSDADYLIGRTGFSHKTPVLENCSEKLPMLMEELLKNSGSADYENLRMTGYMYLILSLLMEHSGSEKEKDILSEACRFIKSSYHLPVSVEDIAAAAGVSRSTLFRAFKAEKGISPVEYLTDIRIKKAEKLLEQTDISINSISRSVGYEDNLYFSRVFGKKTGMTPTEYRNSRSKPR